MKKVFIPEFVTKGYPKPKPTLGGYQIVNSNDNLKEIHVRPMVREVYPSWFDAIIDPEVSLPVLMKKKQ